MNIFEKVNNTVLKPPIASTKTNTSVDAVQLIPRSSDPVEIEPKRLKRASSFSRAWFREYWMIVGNDSRK